MSERHNDGGSCDSGHAVDLSGYCVVCNKRVDVGASAVSADYVADPGDALAMQIGGDHYSKMKIQPVEYIEANGIGFIEGSIIKYVSRHASKGGAKDLKKARHFLDVLLQLRYGEK